MDSLQYNAQDHIVSEECQRPYWVMWFLTKDHKECCIPCFILWRKVLIDQGKAFIWQKRIKKKKDSPTGWSQGKWTALRPFFLRRMEVGHSSSCPVTLGGMPMSLLGAWLFSLGIIALTIHFKSYFGQVTKEFWAFKHFESLFSHFLNR